jgi:alcohol dehydrogenase class IV
MHLRQGIDSETVALDESEPKESNESQIAQGEIEAIGGAIVVGHNLGALVADALERHAKAHTRILLIHGTSFGAHSLHFKPVEDALGRWATVHRFECRHSPTDIPVAAECVGLLNSHEIDLVIAVGGGRVMDIAKVCACYRDRDFPRDIEAVIGARHESIPKRRIPLIAIPTTPGTGSEATPYAVLTGAENRKLFAVSRDLRPDAGLVCPELITTVPPDVIRQSLMDGFMHALEALWALRRTAISDAYACEAIARFGAAMGPFYRHPQDSRLAEMVSTAASLAGLAFAHAYTSLCHALSFPLAQRLHLGHGQCCALTAVQVAGFNSECETPALLRAARSLGLKGADEFPDYLRHARRSLDDSLTLSDCGMTPDSFASIVANTDKGMVSNNAKPASANDLRDILGRCM